MLKHILAAAAPFVFIASIAQAQVSLSPPPLLRFVDNNGQTLQGGKLFTYLAGTTTKITTYTNSTGFTPNTDPIILNARGEAQVWLSPGQNYKFVLAPANDSDPPSRPIWTVDHISNSPAGGVIDARAMGANDNGATDAAPAINNALSLATSIGGCAYLGAPRLAYMVKSATIAVNGCLQETPGAKAGLLLASGASFNLVTLGNGAVVSDVVGDGNGSANNVFEFGASSNASVRNVTARNASGGTTGTGVDFGNSTNGKMIGGLIYGNAEGTNGYLATGALVTAVTAYSNGQHDIGFNTCYECKIINNYVYSGTGGATNLITTYSPANENLVISDNTVVTDGTDDCIRAAGVGVRVTENTCKGGGILISGAAYDLVGTVSVTHGSNVVTGTGTSWLADNYYLNGSGLSTFFYGPDGSEYTILEIDSPTSLKLRSVYAGTTLSGASAKLFGLKSSYDVVVSNNNISNVPSTPGLNQVSVIGSVGVTVAGNEMNLNNAGINGVLINGVTGGNFSANSVNGGQYGLLVVGNFDLQTGLPPPNGGTVTVNNGSTAVVGSGTNWSMAVPSNNTAWFQTDESTDDQLSLGYPPQQVASVTDDTHLTLAAPYTGPNCSGCYYTVALGINSNLNISGGNYNGIVAPLDIKDTINSTFTGFAVQSSALAQTLAERYITYNNNYLACTLPHAPNIAPGSTESCTIWP